MMNFGDQLRDELDQIEAAGLTKRERLLTSPQGAHITTVQGPALNFCANNYLGLANHPDVVAAAHRGLDEMGSGTASVRFICGTHAEHRELEKEITDFVGMEDAILFPSAFDANGALFEVLLTDEDAVISDSLNHASIIDGVRLSKAKRFRYENRNMEELEQRLQDAQGSRRILIVTDGVFSMDGYFAPLEQITALAERYGAAVAVDDSHATGLIGPRGAGTPARAGLTDRVDIITGTLGKALGGASGGFVASTAEVVALLKQRGRPYLFSNAVAPSLVAGARTALRIARDGDDLREHLAENAEHFRARMTEAGFDLLPGSHPIVAVMFPGEDGARQASAIAEDMLKLGVYVIAFSYPVVPAGRARIRVQLSAAHSTADVDACVDAFIASRDRVAG